MDKPEKAPGFCLPDQRGERRCLKDFRGNWVILYFYPRDMTPGCSMEAAHFSWAKEDFEQKGAVILGVSPDTVESHERFCRVKDLSVTLLSDPDMRVIKAFGAWGIKKMYGKETEGVIRSTFLINPEGKIAHEWKNIRVKGHVEAVKLMLEELVS
ncbi:MAG TPA: peroxiredoxin [Firmicutes bacterium]|nr:peroxiredoxin [Bacillota bacterium]